MKEIVITAGSSSSIVKIGESIENINNYASIENTVIITDENVNRLYSGLFSHYRTIVIGTGEEIKNISTIEYIIKKLIELRCDRKTFILGIGGGVVSDIAGFAASIYMRGLNFGFISSSLLSQVDASVGGKNGVNIDGLKNMIGTINQPEFVICDHSMLKTLPDDEYINGIAELIKTSCLDNDGLFQFISDNREKLLKRNEDIISEAVYKSVKFKAKIVEEDEKETGVRKILNLGHTLGHGIEKVKSLKHGFAVAIGISFALYISRDSGLLSLSVEREIVDILKYFGLPAALNEVADKKNISEIIDAVRSDKKRDTDGVDFVLLNGIGRSVIKKIDYDELTEYILDYIERGN
ncbi:MAG: 3-dehydroquinate synthase [Spirochaetes bacterium]|nr:3-dehydroquinate synthase [Spirochaetota bacterium]